MSKRLGEPHETYQRCDIDGWMLSVGSEGDGWNEQRAGGSLVRPTGISPYRPSRPVTCVRASADLFFPFSSSLALLPLLRRRDLLSSYMSISSTTPPGYRARLESAETESHNAYFRSRFSERKKKKKKKKRGTPRSLTPVFLPADLLEALASLSPPPLRAQTASALHPRPSDGHTGQIGGSPFFLRDTHLIDIRS